MKKKLLCIFLALIMLGGCSAPTGIGVVPVTGAFHVAILKVGQADAIILQTENHTVLIDCGEKDDGDEVVGYLQEQGISYVDYLFITHFDKDHVGGVPEVLQNITVEQIITPNYEGTGLGYQAYQKQLAESGLEDTRLTKIMEFVLDDVIFRVYPPLQSSYKAGDNDYSLVISVTHGENSLLFAGDAEKERLQELSRQFSLSHDFLKVPHHGRENSYTKTFFDAVCPQYAVITDSEKNPPEAAVLEYLNNIGCTTYLCSDGNIEISSDGSTLTVTQGD